MFVRDVRGGLMIAAALIAAVGGSAMVQACGGDDAPANDGTTKDAGTTSATTDAGGTTTTTLSCAAPSTQCGDACVDTKHDPSNCGACGTACAAGLVCADGACALACAGGAAKCGDACVDTDVDVNNCGACGKTCGAGQVCSNGACGLTCASPLTMCAAPDGGAAVDGGIRQAFCANVKDDNKNCGACGTTCAANQTCIDGACTSGCTTSAQCSTAAAKCSSGTCVVPKDCSEILELNANALSGPYTIDPDGAGGVAPFQAYCDMLTDGGGWTIVAGYAGADGEQPVTGDVEVAGNPLLFQQYQLSRAKKIALSNLETETLVLRSDTRWVTADKPMFSTANGHDVSVDNSEDAFAVTVNAGNSGYSAGFMGWSNFNITGGGDFGITIGADGPTANNNTSVNGFDHSSTSFRELNYSCARQLLYSYSFNAADGDAAYRSNVNLGDWSSNGCNGSDGNATALYFAMRRAPTAVATSCVALLAANANAPSGWYYLDTDGAGPIPRVRAYCDMTTDGGGYMLLPVDNAVSTNAVTQTNGCQGMGLNLVVPRTPSHLTKMASLFPPKYFQTMGGIYRDVNDVSATQTNNYTGCAMTSTSANKCGTDWKAVGGGAWFIRDVAYSEPNGNYTLNCWLNWNSKGVVDAHGATAFDDSSCNYYTGNSYVCSDNAKP